MRSALRTYRCVKCVLDWEMLAASQMTHLMWTGFVTFTFAHSWNTLDSRLSNLSFKVSERCIFVTLLLTFEELSAEYYPTIHSSSCRLVSKGWHCDLGHVRYFSISRPGLTPFLLIESFVLVSVFIDHKSFINQTSLLNLLLNNINVWWPLLNGCSQWHWFAATNWVETILFQWQWVICNDMGNINHWRCIKVERRITLYKLPMNAATINGIENWNRVATPASNQQYSDSVTFVI